MSGVFFGDFCRLIGDILIMSPPGSYTAISAFWVRVIACVRLEITDL
ncbi:hypothetical protein RSSM_04051 [Rhodopirellula sallentina SM41]|uniref:Uncharacterized protein n=1 Tax=Rhodopirellula sallentina SM41 TaxID=1263870 RepID=M5TZF0_9BACT|nr:hypothetical protein RSSM_04051 [Rhodopirellula sallentina SM41]